MHTRIIDSQPLHLLDYLKQVWSYRVLIWTLARRDLKVRFAQTFLGVGWVIIQPIIFLVVFSFFFDRVIQVDTGNLPYPVFAFTGMILWYYFSYLVSGAGTALLYHQDLMKKIYFPKLILPLSKALVGLVDLGLSLFVLLGVMLLYGIWPAWTTIFLPLFVLLAMLVGLSLAFWLSALTIRYRDFHHLIPFLVNLGIWLTPVFYPGTLIPESLQILLYLNPMAGIIEATRWSLLGGPGPDVYYFIAAFPTLLLFISGLYYFHKVEGKIVDLI